MSHRCPASRRTVTRVLVHENMETSFQLCNSKGIKWLQLHAEVIKRVCHPLHIWMTFHPVNVNISQNKGHRS
jgi:hypothetical protein